LRDFSQKVRDCLKISMAGVLEAYLPNGEVAEVWLGDELVHHLKSSNFEKESFGAV
jgi:hypothetical protein